ncbi:MAG: DegT/DnrJ/EryC1/StrS family aminotransferase [Candidatus Hodarchaeota archaeon]
MSPRQNSKKNFPKWPIYDEEDINALLNVIKSRNWWCGFPGAHEGENVWLFQEEFAKFQEAEYCVAVSNGTVAIESALISLNVGLGDEVIVSDYTFVASASAIIAANAVPIFCDIHPKTFVMNVNEIEKLITERTKAIIPVHLGGNAVEMDKLMKIASNYNLVVVEDCAHAHGSRYKGKRLGNWGDAGTFSFQASKVLTSGEGGAIICNSGELADKIYSFTDCGRKKGTHAYKHFSYGTNYRMTEYQASILRTQLKKFPKQHALRNKNAKYLLEKLNEIDGINVIEPTPGTSEMGWYVFPFVFDPDKFGGINKIQFYKKLNREGIPTCDNYPPLHSLDCFKNITLKKGLNYSNANWGEEKSIDKNFPIVSDIYSRTIEFPQELLLASLENLDWVVETIESLR